MRQVYIKETVQTEPGPEQYYIEGPEVKPGKILVVRSVCCTWSGRGQNEEAAYYIVDTGRKNYLADERGFMGPAHPGWKGCVAIGQGDRVGAYNPDANTNDVISLFVFGELWDLETWRDVKPD